MARTAGFINGREWKEWDQALKLGYVIGLGDGIRLVAADTVGSVFTNSMYSDSTYAEVVEGLDDFYRDPANVEIQVTSAMVYFQKKLSGIPAERLAENLSTLRSLVHRPISSL